jgi:hypothetical protein
VSCGLRPSQVVERSDAVGMRPSGVYLSTASGRFWESLESISSRDSPVC